MITIEEKLGLFNKLVVDQLKNRYNRKVAELEKENALRIEAFKKDAKERSEVFFGNYIKSAYEDRKKRLSRARGERKRNRLVKQQELVEKSDKIYLEVMK